jgi:hypothetical protein
MKVLKFLIRLSIWLMVIAQLSACGSARRLVSSRADSSMSAEFKGSKSRLDVQHYAHQLLVNGSAETNYRAIIFPTDSFYFSLEKGFSGKASRIELSGMAKGRSSTLETGDFAGLQQVNNAYTEKEQVTKRHAAESKWIGRRGLHWVGYGCIGLGLLSAMFLIGRRWARK